jgi:hypothetical protein
MSLLHNGHFAGTLLTNCGCIVQLYVKYGLSVVSAFCFAFCENAAIVTNIARQPIIKDFIFDDLCFEEMINYR